MKVVRLWAATACLLVACGKAERVHPSGAAGAPGGAGTAGTGMNAGTAGTGSALPAGGAGSIGAAGTSVLGGAGTGAQSTGAAGNGAAGSGAAGTGDSDGGATDGAACTDPTDTDGDGTPDCRDECMFDKNKVAPGVCGCGLPDNDSLGDGKIDCVPGRYLEAETGVLSVDQAAQNGGTSAGFTVGDDSSASKGKFIGAPAGETFTGSPGPSRATYDLDVKKDDTYTIWGRLNTPDLKHNCVWARVDGGTWTKWWGTSGEEWFWYALHVDADWQTPLTFQLSAGHHTLVIAGCTDTTRLDRLFYAAGGDRPATEQPMCNPPHTVRMNGQCASSCGQLGGTSCDATTCAGKALLSAYDCAVCCNPAVAASDGGTD